MKVEYICDKVNSYIWINRVVNDNRNAGKYTSIERFNSRVVRPEYKIYDYNIVPFEWEYLFDFLKCPWKYDNSVKEFIKTMLKEMTDV